jgi:hypothetical protein
MFTDPKPVFGIRGGEVPLVTYANRGAFAPRPRTLATIPSSPAKLFVAVGDRWNRWPRRCARLIDVLRRRNYRGLTFESRIIEGERHSGNKPEAFNRGLRFLFRIP